MRDVKGVDLAKYQASGKVEVEYASEELDRFMIEVYVPLKLGRLDEEGTCHCTFVTPLRLN
jgi:hypothetical protein